MEKQIIGYVVYDLSKSEQVGEAYPAIADRLSGSRGCLPRRQKAQPCRPDDPLHV
jgi:hypothetical protein